MSNQNDPTEPRLTSIDEIRRTHTGFPSRQPKGEPVNREAISLMVAEMEALNDLGRATRLNPAVEVAMRSISAVAEKWAAEGAQSLNRNEIAELYAGGLLMAADMAGNRDLERSIAEATSRSFELSSSFNSLIAEMGPMSVRTLAAEADVPITDLTDPDAEVDYSTTAPIAAEVNMTPLALVAAEADLPTVDILVHEMLSIPGKIEMFQAELLNYDLALNRANMTPQGAAAIVSALVAMLQD